MTYGSRINFNQTGSFKDVIDTSIKGGVPETSSFITDNISEIATNENPLTFQAKPSHVSTSKIDVFGGGYTPYSISQISSLQDGTIKTSGDSRFGQVDIAQIDSAHKVVSMQGSHKTGRIFDISEIDYFSTVSGVDNEIGKVSLPSSVSSHQSFKIDSLSIGHNNTFLLISIYSTAQSIWHSNTVIDLILRTVII
jgi:hypothetical protein